MKDERGGAQVVVGDEEGVDGEAGNKRKTGFKEASFEVAEAASFSAAAVALVDMDGCFCGHVGEPPVVPMIRVKMGEQNVVYVRDVGRG